MRIRSGSAAIVMVLAGLVGTSVATAPAAFATHACTKTSTHHCIKGGQFCPKSKKGGSGWDAQGRRYVCKTKSGGLHWVKP